jgi:hypothetical protein
MVWQEVDDEGSRAKALQEERDSNPCEILGFKSCCEIMVIILLFFLFDWLVY